MPDDSNPYESGVRRIGKPSGSRWALAWMGGAVLVIAVGLAGAIIAPPSTPPPALADVVNADASATARTSTAPAATATWPPLIVESTDFHGNGGAAYYGIGGKLIRALGPTAAPTTP